MNTRNAVSCDRCHGCCQVTPDLSTVFCNFCESIKHTECSYYVLFCDQTCNSCNCHLPSFAGFCPAKRCKDPCDCCTDLSQEYSSLMLSSTIPKLPPSHPKLIKNHRMIVERRMIVPAFLMKDQPRSHILLKYIADCWPVVCRKLHNERSRISGKHLCFL